MTEKVQEIIAKHLSGEASKEEEEILREWLSEKQHREQYDELLAQWQYADILFEQPRFDTTNAWHKVASKTIHKGNNNIAPVSKKIAFPRWLAISLPAAAAAIVLGIFIYNAIPGTETISITASDNNKELLLPDNSKVILRAGSELRYAKNFDGDTRELSLSGDARFFVTRNEDKPFVITTQKATVQVLGTQFDVHTEASSTSVTVNSGSVLVKDNNQAQAVLIAHQMAMVTKDGIATDTLLHNNQIYWQTQELTFTAEPLERVVQTISEATRKNITIDKSIDPLLLNQKVTIHFKNQSLEDMLTELCLISKCSWQKQGSKYLVRTK